MKVFASAIGQHDNIGDTVLRRGFLDAVRGAGPLHLYVGRQQEDQLSALGLREDDTLYRRSQEWRAKLSTTMGREPSVYAFDTGETELQRGFALRYARLAPLLILNRLRGGGAAHVGVGIRESTPWRHPIRGVLRLCDVVTWRDAHSRSVMGLGGISPDWAFRLGSTDADLRASLPIPRRKLAVAVRASLQHAQKSEPSARWTEAVAELADRHGLEPVFVAQIRRDGPLADSLAERVGAQSLTWESGHHGAFEERLRALYRESAIVLSDRLHGLVIGATEGAVPLALSADPLDKSTRTLAAAGIRNASVDPELATGGADEMMARALTRRAEVARAVEEARRALDAVATAIARIGRKRGSR
ncbi:hypothetical protein [Naasia sp. SYSU D00948]|uniref:hypothetical protein n=1 Tax=Naasia sp. SYSU D00948 TaxID=2817379 RepID=UPI001B3154CA|nr:hypothetical protein [Naasia sp. SYSU D00948]